MCPNLKRREFLAAAIGAAVWTGCASRSSGGPKPKVSIHRTRDYADGLTDIIRRVIADHKLSVTGKRILLKPNLVEFDPHAPINTHPAVVRAALEAFRSAGAAEVHIAEGPGHRRDAMEIAEMAGYLDLIPRFEDIFTDLNYDEVHCVTLHRPRSRLTKVYLARAVFSYDLLVSMPKMKTHHWAGATLSMKNLFGCVPGSVYGWPKNVLHWAGIHESIADLHSVMPPHFAIVDGIVGMEGNGPIQGKARYSGVIVAGRDMPAVDATCCRLMRIDPTKVPYLQLTAARGQTVDEQVQQIGETIPALAAAYDLIPSFHALRLRS